MREVNQEAPPSNRDSAVATGEMLSGCLLEAAVSRLRLSVTSLNGYTLGIRTNSDFGRASIESVNPTPVANALQEHDIVIAAGGQAIERSGKLTFLGRNSSDLTAVALASTLDIDTCEIYSDVPGVYTADPYIVQGAKLIPEICYSTIAQMSRHGAKVLHYRAVDYAEKHNITIFCKSLTNGRAVTGTAITERGKAGTVTVARDIAALLMASPEERDVLSGVLNRDDINAFCIDENEGPYLCIMTDIDFAMQLIARTGINPVSVVSKAAVTELCDTTLRLYLDDDYERAITRARRIHERLYPGKAGDCLD
ncbi:Aspartate kinase [Neorhizobium galegae bv. officinalis]|uniref:aspartate kinase n=2 Tax=Neorhizobium galegae TaxID=399 RepID=A0A0T7H1N2_NEOGA|nr:Aspartate kinase [Neorhizobium galegae bv. officinalis]CDZ53451.1 Aspartate kinase [Neorhizobium galegae bv. officinalis]